MTTKKTHLSPTTGLCIPRMGVSCGRQDKFESLVAGE